MFKLFNFSNFDPAAQHAVVTIGNFDGVHLGHQALIRRVVEDAQTLHAAGVLLTFQPHPKTVLTGEPMALISSLPLRLRMFERLGLDMACIIPFTREFAAKTAQQFVDEYLFGQFRVKKLIIGYDFGFGRNREGSAEVLLQLSRQHGFMFEVFPAVTLDGGTPGNETAGETVSSRRIRELLAACDFAQAARLLGRPYSVLEPVATGQQRGRTLGFPTANQVPADPLPIPFGVYAVEALVGEQRLGGVANYGVRPTVGPTTSGPTSSGPPGGGATLNGVAPVLETHLFDFSGDLYGQLVEVIPRRKLRDERKFPSLDALKAQIAQDLAAARKLLGAPRQVLGSP
jgi:riboflavin kinase/FMN adenylyltransferase